MKTLLSAVVLSLSLSAFVGSAHAVPIAKGTVSTSFMFNPTLMVGPDSATYAASEGATYQVSASGGFASSVKGSGTLNGSIVFSETPGATMSAVLENLFVFNDGQGGTFNFSAISVVTRSFTDNPGITTSGSIYLLGTATDAHLSYDVTPASLTISFNSTGDSPFSSSATLAVPPAPLEMPEPASLALLGAGLVGIGLIRRQSRSQEPV